MKESSLPAACPTPISLGSGRLRLGSLPETAKQVLVIANPIAGAGRRSGVVEGGIEALRAAGFEVTRVDGLEELGERAGEALDRRRLRCVVAAGGDGTFGAALNATPPGAPLVGLPTGTENLLAGYLRWSRRPAELARLVAEGQPLRLDAGSANGRLFALMASVGFDAEVVRRVHARRRGNISHLAYALPIFETLGRYGYPKLRVTLEDSNGESETLTGSWFFCQNLPRYASGLRLTPDASGTDGRLDLCVLRRGQLMAGVWYLWHIWRRRHGRLASVALRQTGAVRITTSSGRPAPFQIDGDPGGVLPLELSVAPGRLTVLVSRSTAGRLLGDA